jgi:D-glycero-alpha-D-manno-heptose 1-phosphate guanylyltransferase
LEAIVLAGGFGTRLQPIVNDLPKSLALVNGRPFIEFLLNYLSGQEITKIIFSVGYKKEAIQSHLGLIYKHIPLEYVSEDEPLGTGGGIKKAFGAVEGNSAFVLNGDSMFRADLKALRQFHVESVADVTMALRFLEDTERFGAVNIDEQNRIIGFSEKGSETGSGYINGGIYLMNRDFITKPQFPEKFSIEKDCFEKQFKLSRFFGYPAKGYFLDIGIPEDFYRAQDEFRKFED